MKIKLVVLNVQLEHIQKKEIQNVIHVKMELIHQGQVLLYALIAMLGPILMSIKHHVLVALLDIIQMKEMLNALNALKEHFQNTMVHLPALIAHQDIILI